MLCMFSLVIVNLIVIVKTELKKGDRSFRLTNGQDLIIKITIKKLIGKKKRKEKERKNKLTSCRSLLDKKMRGLLYYCA